MGMTSEAAKKIAEKKRQEYGVDPITGKSLYHARTGALGGSVGVGNFRTLKITDPERLKEFQRKGAIASNKKQGKGQKKPDGSV